MLLNQSLIYRALDSDNSDDWKSNFTDIDWSQWSHDIMWFKSHDHLNQQLIRHADTRHMPWGENKNKNNINNRKSENQTQNLKIYMSLYEYTKWDKFLRQHNLMTESNHVISFW